MKPLLLAALLLSTGCFAQTSKGNRFISFTGDLTLNSFKSVYTSNTGVGDNKYQNYTINLDFTAGRFIRDDVAHGWHVGLGFDQIYIPTANYTLSSPSLAGHYVLRRYVSPSDRIKAFAQVQAGGSYNPQIYSGEFRNHLFAAEGSIGVGLSYFYNKRWAIEAVGTLGTIRYSNARQEGESLSTSYELSGGLAVTPLRIGLSRYFGNNAAYTPEPRQSLYVVGQRYWAGDLSGSFHTAQTDNTGISVGVSTGSVVSPSLARGIGISGSFNQTKSFNDVTFNSWGVQVRPFLEWYKPVSGKWTFLINGGVGLGYSYARQNDVGTNATLTSTDHKYNVNPSIRTGIQYQVAPQWGVVAMVGMLDFKGLSVSVTDSQTTKQKSTTTNLTIDPSYSLSNSLIAIRFYPGR